MSDFFRRIKSSAGQVAFEAEKLRRVNRVQSIVKSLEAEVAKAIQHAGHIAFQLFQQSEITQPELLEICGHIAMLQAQIQARNSEIEHIREEEYIEPVQQPQLGRLCPNGHGELPAQAQFCPVCGAQAVMMPPIAAGPLICPSCGATVSSESRFCPDCGAIVRSNDAPKSAQ
ncbi:MAG: zinc ribbon domain-containing protein [Anaerolineae bacterium]|nr:zinc ribbon domain-containing protein [Anaerolineae bacterium]